jgi:glyoxylase-like metal-dependent hydrolase (beta-lactamase superfamily II)
LGWAHTRGDGFVWLPKERILCTGDAVLNGPRNKLWDANISNWPRVIEQAQALHPDLVLPGHGAPGGVEMMDGQAHFLRDLRATVADDVHRGLTVEQATEQLRLPPEDANWVRRNMTEDVQITYSEIKTRKPAGAIPHTWH